MTRDIVCVSTNYWDGEWFRKQQFMSRFAREGHRVLYVEPSFSCIRPVRGRPYVHNRLLRPLLRQDDSGVWILTPRQMVPFVSRTWSSRLNSLLLASQVRSTITRLGFRETLLWVYPAEFSQGVGAVPHSQLLVDIVDDLVAYETRPSRQRFVRRCLQGLVDDADAVIVTTSGLADNFAPDAAVIPNGYDSELFAPTVTPLPELQTGTPIVGFVGTLFRHLDYSLIAEVADEIPEALVVLVGRIGDFDDTLGDLLARSNVRHIAAVERSAVPRYIASFDVCIVPFRVDAVSAMVSPLKAYEYLGMGKPVVSVPMPGLAADPAACGIQYASSVDEFVECVRSSLKSSRMPHLNDAIRTASWDGRFAALREVMGRRGVDVG